METQNDLLNDMEKTTPAKFKLNKIGVILVGGVVCIIWKAVDIILYIIHLF